MPEPHPISKGNVCQGMPLFSTNNIPVSTRRSFKGFRPGYRDRRGLGVGNKGWISSHNSSLTSGFPISFPPSRKSYCQSSTKDKAKSIHLVTGSKSKNDRAK